MPRFDVGFELGVAHKMGDRWTPIDLGPKLIAWWDSSQGVSLSGNQVTAWVDRKSGYSASQDVSAARPVYSATSFNGAPGLTFDGVDDNLSLASPPFPDAASPSEIWAVVQQDALAADTTFRCVFAYGNNAATSRRMARDVSGGVNRLSVNVGDGSSNVQIARPAVDFSSRHVARAQVGASAAQAFLDGAAGTSTAAIPATGNTGLPRIGAHLGGTSSFWNGKIRDVIVTGPLSPDQATALLTFLLARRML